MATVIDALVVTFGLDPSGIQQGATEGKTALNDLKSTALKVFAVIGSAALFTGLVKSSFDAAIAVGTLAETLGEDVEQVGAFGQAVASQGGTVEGFNSSLENLNAAVGEFAAGFGGPGADAFEKFGTSMREANGDMRKSSDVLLDLADHLSQLTIGEAVAIGETMQIDAATIKTIHQGRDATLALIKAQKEKGVMDKESVDAAKRTKESMDDAHASIARLFGAIVQMILPAIKLLAEAASFVADKVSKAFKKISDFVTEHGALVVGTVAGAALMIADLYTASIAKATAAMIRLGIATVIANAPLFITIGIITLLSSLFGLLIEDFMVWMDGGDSAIGSLLGDFETFWATIKTIIDNLGALFAAVWERISTSAKAFFAHLKGLFTGDFDEFFSLIDSFGEKFENIWEAIKTLAAPFFEWIGEKLGGLVKWGGKVASILGLGGEGDGETSSSAPGAKDAISPAIAAAGAGAGQKTVTVTQSVSGVTINTQATDGKGVAAAFNGSTNNELQGLVTNVDSGVMQ